MNPFPGVRDVARPLPHAVQRRLAEQPGQVGLLDVAGAAQALERLGRVHRRPLADPVLHDRGEQPLHVLLVLVVGGARRRPGPGGWPTAWPPRTRWRGRRARWPSAAARRACAEGRAVVGVPGGLGHALAHDGGGAEHAVEPGVVDHLDDRADAAALVADALAQVSSSSISLEALDRSPSLSLSRWMRMGCGCRPGASAARGSR
jgi:hypothetical protein